jgi:hypothetical protein
MKGAPPESNSRHIGTESKEESCKSHLRKIIIMKLQLGKILFAKRFDSVAFIHVQPNLTSNCQIGKRVVPNLLSEVTLKITEQ